MDTLTWAAERGFKLRLPNRIAITKVRDPDALREVFKAAFAPRWIRQEIDPFLGRLPHVVGLTWPDTELLLDALRTTAAFDYEVNP